MKTFSFSLVLPIGFTDICSRKVGRYRKLESSRRELMVLVINSNPVFQLRYNYNILTPYLCLKFKEYNSTNAKQQACRTRFHACYYYVCLCIMERDARITLLR